MLVTGDDGSETSSRFPDACLAGSAEQVNLGAPGLFSRKAGLQGGAARHSTATSSPEQCRQLDLWFPAGG